MEKLQRLIDEVRQLPRAEREQLLEEVQESLERELAVTAARRPPSYAPLIEMAGTVSSAFRDVSTEKYKHLAEAYAPEPGDE